MRIRIAALLCLAAILGSSGLAEAAPAGAASPPGSPADRAVMIRYAAKSSEGIWKKIAAPPDNLASREIFTCAIAMAEAGQNLDRMDKLFDVAAKMQDRDPKSKGYGNFRWSWANPAVMDYNAVEFCMQGGALLWLRHRDKLPEAARKQLREILDFAVEGCLRHKVRESYTNIALMNAQNLILLGEALDLPKAADEGYARLDRIYRYTLENGICEYGSPTYYGTDLDSLVLLDAFMKREDGRKQVSALLDLFWTDIAMNFFAPSQRLAGPHSRDYDYVRGRGILENHLWAAGWITGEIRGSVGAIWPALGRRQPPAALYKDGATRFPRLIRQTWGALPLQFRTHHLAADVTLGSSAANYHNMDMPLTVDLPGPPEYPRCYFITDARRDPYGKVKVPEGKGPHSKTLHLRPFWTAAQRKTDALGLALYQDEDMAKAGKSLESHFVMPRDVDGFWIGDRQVTLKAGAPAAFPLKNGETLVLRKGTAAVGVRVVWAKAVGGKEPTVAFVDDGNAYGVVRLTVTHYESQESPASVLGAGAAMWVRVGSHLTTDAALAAWRKQFAEARAEARADGDRLVLRAAGADGPLQIETTAPKGENTQIDPPPARCVLEVDGKDIGRETLSRVPLAPLPPAAAPQKR
jgi:hypothetical protein